MPKENENETIEEFNKRFNQITQKLHQDIKPPKATILIYYLDSFDGELGFQIREKDPQNLRVAQELAIKIEKNMMTSGKSNLLSSSKSHTKMKTQSKAINTIEPTPDPITALT
jgi:hypothetical protein